MSVWRVPFQPVHPIAPWLVSALLGLILTFSSPLVVSASYCPSAEESIDLRGPTVPGRDLGDLVARFGRLGAPLGGSGAQATGTSERARLGESRTFWVLESPDGGYRQVQAALAHEGEIASWFVEPGLVVAAQDLARTAAMFDQRIYPSVRRFFGPEPLPGVDGDPRLAILLARLPGMGAYFSSVDLHPRAVHPRSNQREMLYVDPLALRPGSPEFGAALAHEFQHLVQWCANPWQETWLVEGSAELAAALVGFRPSEMADFSRHPDTSLTNWTDQASGANRHYEAAYLFMRYVLERYLAPEELMHLLQTPGRGAEVFDRFWRDRGEALQFVDVFKDWVAANFLDEMFPGGGRFGYHSLDISSRPSAVLPVGAAYEGSVQQFGAVYVELVPPLGIQVLQFEGIPATPLLDSSEPPAGQFWWSNRGDNVDTRLTRAFDLRAVASPRLRFRLWYDTESNFDYGYLLVSEDGGRTWQSLCTSEASREDRSGNNLGCGFSGISGTGTEPVWLEEEVDLSPYAGREILVRFEYVTDQAYHGRGVAVADVEVPELVEADFEAPAGRGWTSAGFVRSGPTVPQDFAVQVLLYRGPSVEVIDLPLDSELRGELSFADLGAGLTRAVVAVSGLAADTTQPATFTLRVQ